MRCSEDQVRQHDAAATRDHDEVISNQDSCHVGELSLGSLCAPYDAGVEVPRHGWGSLFYGDPWNLSFVLAWALGLVGIKRKRGKRYEKNIGRTLKFTVF